ncbi:MAG TPA: L,D-transpeptidase family protein, partial [Gammaproteobacteria bacterium]|nr:L,D-transpeptidase family protein [Gammaproteobacteria bacterium]
MRANLFRALFLAVLVGSASASTEPVVGNAFFRGVADQRMVLVAKDAGTAYLLESDGNRPRVVKRFSNILMGANGGDKLFEGDKRTPEGVYYIQRYIPPKELAAIYGDGAFPLNYPNIVDRIEDKTGYGIWLHGVDEDAENKTSTQGCVAFNNAKLNELKQVLDIGTPVVITKQADFLKPERYRDRRQELMDRFQGFLTAWEQSDFQALESYIHPEFRNGDGQGAEGYLAEKRKLMRYYPERRVEAHNLRVYKENGHRLVYDYNQFYCAANVAAYGRKRLYFAPHDGKNRVIAEEYFARSAAPLIRKRVRDFVEGWRDAWENEELDDYMGHYAEGFRHNGASRAEWRDYKKGVFARRTGMDVGIENLWIRQLRGNRYQVGFDQRFESDGYEDYGVK